MSLAEEEERKAARLAIEKEEDEQLRLALEESLKLSQSPALETALEEVTLRTARRHAALLSARKLDA